MNEDDGLSAIRARRAMITPGAWIDEITDDGFLQVASHVSDDRTFVVAGMGDMEQTEREDHCNAEFIAHAPADIDWLIAELTDARSRAQIAEDHYAALAQSVRGEGSEGA